MKYRNIGIFLIMISIGNIFAQNRLVLDESGAVKLALEENINLKQSSLDLESSIDEEKYIWNNLLPDLSLNAGLSSRYGFIDNGTIDISKDPLGLNISSGATLSVDYTNFLSIDKTVIEAKSQMNSYLSDEKSLEISIRKQFKYLLAYNENLAIQEKNINLAQKRYDQAKLNFSNGLISELTLLTAQNTVESLKPSYQDADTTYKQLVMSFKNSLGVSLTTDIELVGDLEVERYDFDAELLINSLLGNRLDVKASLIGIELSEIQASITSASNLLPTLNLSALWSNSIDSIIENSNWTDSLTLSATFSIPLDGYVPGSSQRVQIDDSKRNVERSKLSAEITKSSAEEEIRSIFMELEGAWANIETTKFSVELAQKTYEMTDKSFERGTSELLDLEDTQYKLIAAKQDLLMSKYKYLSAILDLENALNCDINQILEIQNNLREVK